MNEQETKKLLNKLITEQVNQVLSEVVLQEEYEDPLAQVFLQPFKDVVDTARHGLEKTAAKVWGNTAKLAKQAATLLIPGIPVDAFTKDADEKIKARLGEIDTKYQAVIKRNYDMMRSRDLWGVPFLLNPGLMTGVEMASHAPVVVLSTIEALTGGNPTITKMRERANTITQRVKGGGFGAASGAGWVGGDSGGGGDIAGLGEGSRNSVKAFREQQEPQPALTIAQVNKNLGKQIENVLKHPTIQNAIKNSELTKQLRQIGIDSMLSTVQDAVAFSSYDEMKQKMASNPNFAAIEADFMKNLPEDATEQQIAELKNAIVGEMKTIIKQVYIKQLEKLLTQSPDMKKELSGLAKQIQAL
jgi:hypothetical protein